MLYPLIEANLSTFRDYLSERDVPLPRFAMDEINEYLHCGRLEHSFVRVKCNGCRHERLASPAAYVLVHVPWVTPGILPFALR